MADEGRKKQETRRRMNDGVRLKKKEGRRKEDERRRL